MLMRTTEINLLFSDQFIGFFGSSGPSQETSSLTGITALSASSISESPAKETSFDGKLVLLVGAVAMIQAKILG